MVLESSQNSSRRLKAFKESQDEITRERIRIAQDFIGKMHEEDVKIKNTLSKTSIKTQADQILERHAQLKEMSRKII